MDAWNGAPTITASNRRREDPMNEKSILIAYDGSDSARRALEEAAALVRNGERVTIVSVAEELPQVGRAPAMLLPEEDEDRKHQLLEAKEVLRRLGVNAELVERRGDAASKILDEAEKQEADLIVLGSRGLNSARRWLVGSVSTRVMHHASCNVLVVH
jgi:nucleotide-binding universal stress UspA family protein